MASSTMQPGSHTATCDVAHARPFMADPHTGQTICSCQYDRFMRSCFPSPTAPPSGFSPFSTSSNNGDHPSAPPPGMNPYLAGAMPPGVNHPSHDHMSMYGSSGLVRSIFWNFSGGNSNCCIVAGSFFGSQRNGQ